MESWQIYGSCFKQHQLDTNGAGKLEVDTSISAGKHVLDSTLHLLPVNPVQNPFPKNL